MLPNLADLKHLDKRRVWLRAEVGNWNFNRRIRMRKSYLFLQRITLRDGTLVRTDYTFAKGKGFRALHMRRGDRVEFSARLTIEGGSVQLRYPMHIHKLDLDLRTQADANVRKAPLVTECKPRSAKPCPDCLDLFVEKA
jgi:hypothetical protein